MNPVTFNHKLPCDHQPLSDEIEKEIGEISKTLGVMEGWVFSTAPSSTEAPMPASPKEESGAPIKPGKDQPVAGRCYFLDITSDMISCIFSQVTSRNDFIHFFTTCRAMDVSFYSPDVSKVFSPLLCSWRETLEARLKEFAGYGNKEQPVFDEGLGHKEFELQEWSKDKFMCAYYRNECLKPRDSIIDALKLDFPQLSDREIFRRFVLHKEAEFKSFEAELDEIVQWSNSSPVINGGKLCKLNLRLSSENQQRMHQARATLFENR